MLKHFFYLGVLLVFSGCAEFIAQSLFDTQQQHEEETPLTTKYQILQLRVPQFSFYDFASITKKRKSIEVKLYTLGKKVVEISIEAKKICYNSECIGKWEAAKQIFGKVSYANLLEDILLGNDIFDGEGKYINTKNGAMVQWFVKGEQEIYYERTKEYTLFKNLSAGITIGVQSYDSRKQ